MKNTTSTSVCPGLRIILNNIATTAWLARSVYFHGKYCHYDTTTEVRRLPWRILPLRLGLSTLTQNTATMTQLPRFDDYHGEYYHYVWLAKVWLLSYRILPHQPCWRDLPNSMNIAATITHQPWSTRDNEEDYYWSTRDNERRLLLRLVG